MNCKILSILTSALMLCACTENAETPGQVAEKYWNALKNGDSESARQLVSKHTQQNLEDYLALQAEQKTTIKQISLGTQQATVVTIIRMAGETESSHNAIETVLVLEDGQWKIDASRTQAPAEIISTTPELEELAKQLSESMQENMDSMDDAFSEGIEMLNEALRGGSQEIGESLLKGMNEMNQVLQDAINKMKQQKKQNQSVDKDTGEGMI